MTSALKQVLIAALATGALTTTAVAGMKTGQQVYISDAARTANGQLGYVRNTADTVQYIGCTVQGDVGSCTVRNRDGLTRSCSSTETRWVHTMRALKSDSYLQFNWDANGKCTYVSVNTDSTSAPK